MNKTVQVLIATMKQNDYSLLDKMHIESDAIVGNQCERNCIDSFFYKGRKITYLNFHERGVGLNRNNALMRATGDYCLFADDDMVYVDHYESVVVEAFESHPDADVIIFNLFEKYPKRYRNSKEIRVHYLNYLRYGAARIAVRLQSIRANGIFFNQCFGGGTEHSHGEDNLFLHACLKAGLSIVAVPIDIAELSEERPSSWNEGYTVKFFIDQGYLYKTLNRHLWRLLCLQDAIRHQKRYEKKWTESYNLMISWRKNAENSNRM